MQKSKKNPTPTHETKQQYLLTADLSLWHRIPNPAAPSTVSLWLHICCGEAAIFILMIKVYLGEKRKSDKCDGKRENEKFATFSLQLKYKEADSYSGVESKSTNKGLEHKGTF